MARVIVITSGKGGVGKSTVTALLGKSLAKLQKRVALIDCDLGLKNLDVILGLESRVVYDFEDVRKGRASLWQALVKDKEFDNLYLLPACLRTDISSIENSELETVLKEMDSSFDFILIDSPAGIEKGFHQAIHFAHEALVVVTLDKVSIKDADKVIGLLDSEDISSIHVLVNRVPLKESEKGSCLTYEDVERVLRKKILGSFYESKEIRRAQNYHLEVKKELGPFLIVASALCGEKREKEPDSLWKRIMKKVRNS